MNVWHEYWPQIADTMDGGLVLIGTDGKLLLINRAFERITGFSKEELLGKDCTIFHCDSCEGVREESADHWCRLFMEPHVEIEACRCDLIAKNGAVVPVVKKASILRDKEGNVLGAVETLVDISPIVERDQKIDELSKRVEEGKQFFGMDGRSPIIRKVFSLIEKAALSEFPVIIYGESGTGKELAAQAIHLLSQRRDGPFISVNCASLSESLLESEFFGHVKGAFTGAYRHRKGRFEAAHRGSILLDEIGDMPLSTQVKLLRVLEKHTIERVGDQLPILVDVRLIAATNRDLAAMVKRKEFREDLFFRINVIPIHMPPLRDRMEDLPLLVEMIIADLRQKTGKPITGISKAAMDLFMNYRWSGNIRELRSALQFAFVVTESGQIEPDHLPNQFLSQEHTPIQTKSVKEAKDTPRQKTELIDALRKAGGNKSEAARILGVTRATVWNRILKYGVKTETVIA